MTVLLAAAARAGDSSARKIGTYDSRIVAYAHAESPLARAALDRLVAEVRAATDPAKAAAGKKQLAALQWRRHLQVFSTAPADEALAALGPRLAALQNELGLERLVSKWDRAGLAATPVAETLEVTDRLVAEFLTPDAKQQRVIESLKRATPLPLWQAKLRAALGQL